MLAFKCRDIWLISAALLLWVNVAWINQLDKRGKEGFIGAESIY